jgi:hypothetical protein
MDAIARRYARPLALLAVITAVLLAACTGGTPAAPTPLATPAATGPATTAPEPSAVPTEAVSPIPPPQAGGPRVALQSGDAILLADAQGQTTQLTTTGDFGFDPSGIGSMGGAAGDALYLLTAQPALSSVRRVVQVDASGVRALEHITPTGYALVVWPGGSGEPARLAWNAVQAPASGDQLESQLYVATPQEGSTEELLRQSSETPNIYHPLWWSADGRRLYFSNEPTGLGGYILFAGASSVSVHDFATGENVERVAQNALGGLVCIHDLAPDEASIAHTCGGTGGVTLFGLVDGTSVDVRPPAEIAGEIGQRGSARFSPDGTQVAFAAARGNPDDELGWVLVSDTQGGSARLVATAPPGQYFVVMDWLDDATLVLQSYGETPAVWLVAAAGGESQKVADGVYLAVMPGRGG